LKLACRRFNQKNPFTQNPYTLHLKMKLSNFTQGRDNNFNLIRIVAALAVLIEHSFILSTGTNDAQPFKDLGKSMAQIGVDVFFITSGFLVTASLLTRQSAIEFIWARVLRIYPALVVMLLLTVFGLGIFFTQLPISSYLANSMTYVYLLKCATLITGAAYELPGVFEGNPFKNAVNGSLWTMPIEIAMYAILVIVWIALRVTKRSRLRLFKLAIVAGAAIAGGWFFVRHFYLAGAPSGFSYMFFSGAAFCVLKEHIKLSGFLFLVVMIALVFSAMANRHAFFVVYELTIVYFVIYFAYVPSGLIRKYNQIGDYSYGVYIYAFPVQQSVAALVPGISVLSMALIATVITFVLAALSWHLLERHALGLKGLYVGHTTRILAERLGR
jgi:peptidoglycan/LPS O-acetylase OafA/YrhL